MKAGGIRAIIPGVTYCLLLVLAFIVGAIPFGYLVARVFYRTDIRTLGSGNIGMTNVWRSFGPAPGLATFILDVAKGLAPVLAARLILGLPFYSEALISALALSGIALAAILGHTFTPFLRFRGGKGIATGLGVLIALLGTYVLIPLGVFAVVLGLFRYVSLGSLAAIVGLLLATIFVRDISPYLYLALAAAVLIFYTHRDNIRRLAKGEERKVSFTRRP